MQRPSIHSKFVALAAVAALALQGCRDATDPRNLTSTMSMTATEPAPLVPRIIAPQATGAEIDWIPSFRPEFNHHFVWLDPSAPRFPKLVVFLPGFEGKPRCCQLMESEIARLGYYVIGLMYPNEFNIVTGCSASLDPDCAAQARLEILDGVDRSGTLSVNYANSIDNRLIKLLVYLDQSFPSEGWSRFLQDGEPDWSKIVISGNSFGAGQAALIGTVRKVKRVVMISGPAPEETAPWISIGETPAAKYFVLYHQHETWTSVITANVGALGLDRFGSPVAPELSEPPYGGTHLLATDLVPRGATDPAAAHLSTSVDVRTPLAPDGTPLLRDAWRYLWGAMYDEEGPY
jgi:hypothetical protein